MIKDRKKKKSRVLARVVLVLLLFGAVSYYAFSLGYSYGKKGIDLRIGSVPVGVINTEDGKPKGTDFSLFWEAWNSLQKNYLGELNPSDLLYGAISGMYYATGDPYTVFLTPEESQQFIDDISGEFQGIGVEITLQDGLPMVVSPLADSPAEAAGIKSRDIIFAVDDTKTSDISFEKTVSLIRGDAGTEVELTIIREGVGESFKVKIERRAIKVASVTYETKNYQGKEFAYIKVRQFGDDTDDLFSKIAMDINKSVPEGIILDLRNNPGGYLETSVNLASYFIKEGVVVFEVDKNNKKREYKTTLSAALLDYPLVVLVNEGSASASEIVAGAIKDKNRGKIIGKKTFGKGSVQIMESLSNGSAIKITMAKWLTPNEDHIDEVGITPEIDAEDIEGTDEDEALTKALETLIKK